jgi:hypothetical protein
MDGSKVNFGVRGGEAECGPPVVGEIVKGGVGRGAAKLGSVGWNCWRGALKFL